MRALIAVLALAGWLLGPVPEAALAEGATDSVAEQSGGLFVLGDLAEAGTCVLMSRFAPGERVVFRARVVDAQTGRVVPDAEAVAVLDNGITIPLRYGPHPPPQVGPSFEEYWTGVWAIRPDTPPGLVRFTIEARAGDRTGTFEPFNNLNSMLTVAAP